MRGSPLSFSKRIFLFTAPLVAVTASVPQAAFIRWPRPFCAVSKLKGGPTAEDLAAWAKLRADEGRGLAIMTSDDLTSRL